MGKLKGDSQRREQLADALHNLVGVEAGLAGTVAAVFRFVGSARESSTLVLFAVIPLLLAFAIFTLITYLVSSEQSGLRFEAYKGDLAEQYDHMRERLGDGSAYLWLVGAVVRSIPYVIRSLSRG